MVRRIKIFLSGFLTVLFLTAFFCPIAYGEDGEERLSKKYVFDDAELVNETDEEALELRCAEASEKYKIDINIATTNYAEGKGAMEYAEDFIIKKDLGYEKDGRIEKSCVLFLIDLDNGETYIATSGLGILCIEDEDIEIILDQVYNYIYSDYYLACLAYVDKTTDIINDNMKDYAGEYVDEWENYDGGYSSFYNKYVEVEHNVFYRLRNPVVCLVIASIIGGVSVILMAYSNKAKMTSNGNTYMNRRDLKVHVKNDTFVNTTTVKHRINNDSSGGGSGGGSGGSGGSFHSGSGGRSFGGGGRKL